MKTKEDCYREAHSGHRFGGGLPDKFDFLAMDLYANQFKPQWIDVKIKLPVEGDRYWCYVEELNDLGKSYFQWNCYFDPFTKEFRDNHKVFKVTHWTNLLPRPSKNETNSAQKG